MFVDALFKKEELPTIRENVAKFADATIASVRTMIDQVTWAGPKSKKVGILIRSLINDCK